MYMICAYLLDKYCKKIYVNIYVNTMYLKFRLMLYIVKIILIGLSNDFQKLAAIIFKQI